ncbi:MAG: glycogen debranching protein GlgX, partial [Angustibacter sp.]
SLRNLLGTLMCSTGVPMLAAGDECGRTQRGNNNAYCQDNDISWFNWDFDPWQVDLRETARFLIRLRRDFPVLGQREFFGHRPTHLSGTKDLEWFRASGTPMTEADWQDYRIRTLQVFLDARAGTAPGTVPATAPVPHSAVLLIFQGGAKPVECSLPGAPWARDYTPIWDSSWPRPRPPGEPRPPGPVLVAPRTLQLWAAQGG